jgi:hypothetical protein
LVLYKGGEMNAKQSEDMVQNILEFKDEYTNKYMKGQKEHSGNLWEMGLKQVVGNAKEEVLDMWSYLMTIEKVMGGISGQIEQHRRWKNADITHYVTLVENIDYILNRRKKD